MNRVNAQNKAVVARQLAQQKREEALRLPHGPRRNGLIAWAKQFEAEAEILESNWSAT